MEHLFSHFNLEGITPEPNDTVCGVPQGSILGPLFLLIKLFLYADWHNWYLGNISMRLRSHTVSKKLDCLNEWLIEKQSCLEENNVKDKQGERKG